MFLILAAVVPTALATAVGIVLLAVARRAADVVFGILVLAFCALAITGAVLVHIFVRRGESQARLQNDFVSSVSHELRTPLTSIRMFVETLALGRVTDPAEAKRCLNLLGKETLRLEQLIEKVLDLARLEAGKRPFDRKPTPVGEIVDGAVAAFDAIRLGTPVTLTRDIAPDLVVDVDRGAIEQVLVNLLTNAFKYTGDDKRIEIRAAPHKTKKRKVEVTVADNGPGIAKGDEKLIFEPFERGAGPERGSVDGTGLGLAVVNLIVRAHKGRVEVDSAPGQGARFRISLPRAT
jgi:two-component system phosphate regulon sensor histidine kinase PhoR